MTKDILARYQQIALDIAQCIVVGKFPVGGKIHGRSMLAGMYNVSPETIRKAVSLLQDMDVVEVVQGSGIKVLSIESAYEFIQRFKGLQSVGSLKNELEELMEQKRLLDLKFEKTITEIINFSDRLKNISPYNPVEVRVPAGSKYIGRNISEMRFWQRTGGTIVALRKGDNMIISPGPFAVLEEGDAIVVVGNDNILQDVEAYLAATE